MAKTSSQILNDLAMSLSSKKSTTTKKEDKKKNSSSDIINNLAATLKRTSTSQKIINEVKTNNKNLSTGRTKLVNEANKNSKNLGSNVEREAERNYFENVDYATLFGGANLYGTNDSGKGTQQQVDSANRAMGSARLVNSPVTTSSSTSMSSVGDEARANSLAILNSDRTDAASAKVVEYSEKRDQVQRELDSLQSQYGSNPYMTPLEENALMTQIMALQGRRDDYQRKINEASNEEERLDAEVYSAERRKQGTDYSKFQNSSEFNSYAQKGKGAYDRLVNGVGNGKYTYMTSAEQKTYEALYGKNQSEARAYLEYIDRDINKRMTDESVEEAQAFGEKSPVLASITSTLGNVASGAGYLYTLAQLAQRKEVDPNSPFFGASNVSTNLREGVSNTIDSGVGRFLYQTGMSMSDFLLQAYVTGGLTNGGGLSENLALAMMGGDAASNTYTEAKKAGKSDRDAFALSTFAGIAEVLTEKVSLETLLNKIDGNRAWYVVKNMLAEGSEEVAADTINTVADFLVMQDKNEWKTEIEKLQKDGMSYKDAWHKVFTDKLVQTGASFLGGALSGGVMAGGSVALDAIRSNGKVDLSDANQKEFVTALVEDAQLSNENSEAYKKAVAIQEKLDNGESITAKEVESLQTANEEEIHKEDASLDMLLEAKNDITEVGQISDRMVDNIIDSNTALSILKKDTGLTLTADMSKDQMRSAIENALKTYDPTYRDITADVKGKTYSATLNNGGVKQDVTTVARVQDGSVYFNTRNGIVSADDITFDDPALDNVIHNFAGTMNATAVQGFMNAYQGNIQNMTPNEYAMGYIALYAGIRRGRTVAEIQLNNRYAAMLNDEAVTYAQLAANEEVNESGRIRNDEELRGDASESTSREDSVVREDEQRPEVHSRDAESQKGDGRSTFQNGKQRIVYFNHTGEITARQRHIVEANNERGVSTVFFDGQLEINGKLVSADAAVSIDGKTMFIQNPSKANRFRLNNTYAHEVGHLLKRDHPRVFNRLVKAIKEGAGDSYNAVYRAYAQAYKGLEADIDEEIACDVIGGLVKFGKIESVQEVLSDIRARYKLPEVRDISGNFINGVRYRETNGEFQDLGSGVAMSGDSVIKASLSSWTESEQERVKTELLKAGFTNEQIDGWMDDVNGVASIIAADKDRLDFKAADNQVFMKPNQEYYITLDASTLCAKRLLYQGTFNAIQHKLPNMVLTSDMLLDLLDMMNKNGDKTPCGVCYVESRRRHLGKFASDWRASYKGEYVPTQDEITTTDGLEKLRKEHPTAYNDFIKAMNKKGTSNPKVVQLRTDYRGDLQKLTPSQINKIIRIGGVRMQSFSDFETPHLLDVMQSVMDLSSRKLTSQAYTKVPNFAAVFGNTGIKINLSLIADGSGVDENGNLVFSSKEGMDIDEALALRERYSENVGTIIVGANDTHILKCMADPRIDYIIPFHRSGWGAHELEMMHLDTYTDYTAEQNERDIKTGDKLPNLYPIDYWDYNKTGKENAEKYLELCKEQGRIPKFSRFLVDNGDGSYSLQPDGSTDGYWKTLIDFKMYDNNGVGAPQQAVQPNFNMEEAERVLGEYEGKANELPVSNKVVGQFVEKYSDGMKFSASDTGMGNGYVGKSMSVNAQRAYADGQKPMTKWNKASILEQIETYADISEDKLDKIKSMSTASLKDAFLSWSSWHHTGSLYNPTSFYSVDIDYVENCDIDKVLEDAKNKPKQQIDKEAKAKNTYALEEAKGTLAKLHMVFNEGISKQKTFGGLVRSYMNGNVDIDSLYASAEESAKTKIKNRVEQWKHQLSPSHWRYADVQRYNENPSGYIDEEFQKQFDELSKDRTLLQDVKKQILDSMNTENGGVRLSLASTNEEISPSKLIAENTRLKKTISRLNAEFRLSGVKTISDSTAGKIANNVLDRYSSDYDKTMLQDNIKKLYEYVNNSDDAYWDDIASMGTEMVKEVMEKGKTLNTEHEEAVTPLREAVKEIGSVKIPQDMMDTVNEIGDTFFGYKSIVGKYVNIDQKNGTDITDWFEKLERKIPNALDLIGAEKVDASTLATLGRFMQSQFNGLDVDSETAAYSEFLKMFEEVLNAPEFKTYADKKAEQISNLRKQYNEARDYAVRAAKVQYDWEMAELRKRYSEDRAKSIADARTQTRQAIERRQSKSKARRGIKQISADLKRMMTRPKKGSYVPVDLFRAITKVCDIVDLDTGKGETKTNVALMELQQQYRAIAQNEAYNGFYKDSVDDELIKDIDDLVKVAGDKPVREMNSAEMNSVYKILSGIKHQVTEATKLIDRQGRSDIRAIGNKVLAELNNAKGYDSRFTNWYSSRSLDPIRMFRRMSGYENGELVRLSEDLNDGQRKMNEIQMEGAIMFRHLVQGKENATNIKEFQGKNAKIIDTGVKVKTDRGNTTSLKLTPAMRVSLYMHSLNSDNMRHILGGGIKIPNFTEYAKGRFRDAWNDGTRVVLTEENVNDIISGMTDYEKEFAKTAYSFFNGFTKNYINDTSLKLNGYQKATLNNYFPISVDSNFLQADFEALKKDGTIEGMGMLKERVNSKKPILLDDICNVISRQLNNVAKYAGLAIPLRNFNRVYNVNIVDYDNDTQSVRYVESVKETMQRVWGSQGTTYIKNFIDDLQGARKQPSNIFNWLKGNFAQATLAINMSVTAKQAASYPTAAAIIGWKPLVKALAKGGKSNRMISRADLDLIGKYTPLMWLRGQGYLDSEMGDMVRGENWTKKVKGVMGWIQAVDLATTGRLWYASQYYVDDNTDLKKGTDEYYKEVAKVFNRVIEETQPNYSVMQRPDILRDPNQLVKSLTMFMTQRLQNFGIMYDSVGNYSAKLRAYNESKTEANKTALKEAKTYLARSMSSQAVAAATIAAITLVTRALLHKMNPYRDKDEEITAPSVIKQVLVDFGSTLAGAFVGGNELFTTIQSFISGQEPYGVEITSVQSINDFVSNVYKAVSYSNKWMEAETEAQAESYKKSTIGALRSIGFKFAEIFGVPASNVYNIFNGIVKNGEDIANGEFLSFNSDAPNLYGSKYGTLYKALMDGDTETATTLRNELNQGASASTIDMGVADILYKRDERISEAAQMRLDGDIDGYKRIVNEIVGEGHFNQNIVIGAINKAMTRLQKDEPIDYSTESKDKPVVEKSDVWRAYQTGDPNTFKTAVDAYIEDGNDESDLADLATTKFHSGEMSSKEYQSFLTKYCDIDTTEAKRKTREGEFYNEYKFSYSGIKSAVKDGTISSSEVVKEIAYVEGISKTEAQYRVDAIDLEKQGYKISVEQIESYNEEAIPVLNVTLKSTGISINDYAKYITSIKGLRGDDADGDGKTDNGSLRAKILSAIDALNITPKQKDALYYQRYSPKTIDSAPWR